MNFSDLITNHGKRVKKEHYIHLIQVSKVDGIISGEEMGMLHKQGRKFGLTDPEIDNLIEKEIQNTYHPPYSLNEKFEHLYNIAEMILADNVIDEKERKTIRKFALEAGFKDESIDDLLDILFGGIRNNADEESILSDFKKHLFR
jgi:uncharacterized membrane protein YebE (DUF533 family)